MQTWELCPSRAGLSPIDEALCSSWSGYWGTGAPVPGLPCATPGSLCHLKTVTQCHLRCHWVSKTSADMVLANRRFCPSVQGALAKQDPQRCLRGCWVLSSGDWSGFNFQSKSSSVAKGWCWMVGPVSSPWNCLYLWVWPRGPKSIPWSKLWLEFPCWGLCIWPWEGWMGASTFWESPPDGARVWQIKLQRAVAGAGKIGHRPGFYWIVSVTGVSWASLASRALACNRKRSALKMRKKEMCFCS